MLKYKAFYAATPTQYMTRPFFDERLYVEGRSFRHWWNYPMGHLQSGAYFAVASDNEVPIGVGIINRTPNGYMRSRRYLGAIGFYVKPKYRSNGVAEMLLTRLENLHMQKLQRKPELFEDILYPKGVLYSWHAEKVMNKAKKLTTHLIQ